MNVRCSAAAPILAVALALGTTAVAQSPPERPGWLGIRGSSGVAVQSVVPDGPAARAGLLPCDVIVGFEAVTVVKGDELLERLSRAAPGDELRLRVVRAGEEREVVVRLGEFPERLWSVRESGMPSGDGLPKAKAPPAPPAPPGTPGVVLVDEGRQERAYLGVRVLEMTGGLAGYFGLEEARGVLIEHVPDGSPAAEAGLRAGDVLLSVAGTPISDMTELGQALRGKRPGDEVTVVHRRRDEGERQVQVRLGSRLKQVWSVSAPPPAVEATSLKRQALEVERQRLKRRLEELEREAARLKD